MWVCRSSSLRLPPEADLSFTVDPASFGFGVCTGWQDLRLLWPVGAVVLCTPCADFAAGGADRCTAGTPFAHERLPGGWDAYGAGPVGRQCFAFRGRARVFVCVDAADLVGFVFGLERVGFAGEV